MTNFPKLFGTIFQFPFDEPPQDEIGEPSHRKENLNRNPFGGNPLLVRPSTKIADPAHQEQGQGHRQDDPAADKVPGQTTQGTDFTATIPTNREESNTNQGQRLSDGPQDKRYINDETGAGGTSGGSDGLPHRQHVYTNVHTKAITQRIRPEWFVTPRYPSPLRRWVPYTQSTAIPRGVTRGKGILTKGTAGSNTEGYGITINRDDIGTGLEANERNGYVSDRNLTDGNQGNENTPEARAWTSPIPHNFHTKQTTGPMPYILNTEQTATRKRLHSPMPPDTFSTMSPYETKPPGSKSTGPLPPLAPLTKWPKVTTREPTERIYNPNRPRGNASYPGIHNENHNDGYHHDGDMEQYYRDYHGDQEMSDNTSNQRYRTPEEKQAPAHEIYETGGYDFESSKSHLLRY